MQRWFPIKTERLLLREISATDFADVHEYASDPIVTQFEFWGPNTPDVTANVVQSWLTQQQEWPREEVNLGVELSAEHKLIGVITLRIKDDANRTADFGFAFNRRYWNQGYGTESARAVIDAAFRTLAAHRVWAGCDTRNVGSYRVMEKLGMRREAHLKKDTWQKGQWRDSYRYAVLEEEWLRG
jgi:ribosomal-protein-alanine N-acetyltransferase